MRSYKLPAKLHDAFVQELRTKFRDSIRISNDLASENVFVSATKNDHSAVAQLAASYTGSLHTPLPDQNGPIRYRESRSQQLGNAMQAAQRENTNPEPSSANYSTFVRVPVGQIDRVQQQLMAIFSTRLGVVTVDRRQIFALQTLGEVPGRIEIEFDRLRSGVLVGGGGVASSQLTLLIESLARSRNDGRGMKVFGLRRDNHKRLQNVIESGANFDPYRRQATQQLSKPTVRRLPSFTADQRIRPAQYTANDDHPGAIVLAQANQDANSNPLTPTGVGPVRQFEGVDVESLPDLDVIILRGPDEVRGCIGC